MNFFNNTEIAFKLKSDSELKRARFIFKMMQNKLVVNVGSALTKIALKLYLPVEGLIRSTVFDHFCGGVTEDDCLPLISNMYDQANVSSVLDYSVEGKEQEFSFDEALYKVLKIIDFSQEKDAIPFAVFKPTGFGRFDLYVKVSEGNVLSNEEFEEWNRVVARFDKVCALARSKGVPVLIDAEESWMQKAADELVERMMQKYNTERAIVFNTLQMYRHDRMEYLKNLHQSAHQNDFYIGMKVVRGAYMEKERKRADEQGYESPICIDKDATDTNYDNAINYMMEHQKMALFAGTHNEESSILLMNLITKLGHPKNHPNLWFGQLLGMSDHISFNLAKEGYNVAKYVPFGPVREVMPYLIRRAEENTSIEGQTSRELSLLNTERTRRGL